MHWMHWGGGWLIMVFWPVIVVLGILLLVKWIGHQGAPPEKSESASDILKKRYARGEITRDEFQRMKEEIT